MESSFPYSEAVVAILLYGVLVEFLGLVLEMVANLLGSDVLNGGKGSAYHLFSAIILKYVHLKQEKSKARDLICLL